MSKSSVNDFLLNDSELIADAEYETLTPTDKYKSELEEKIRGSIQRMRDATRESSITPE